MSLVYDLVCWLLSLLLIVVGKANSIMAGTIPYAEASELCKTERSYVSASRMNPFIVSLPGLCM